MVLLGDAKATAHFLDRLLHQAWMEDAIALADAMHHAPTGRGRVDSNMSKGAARKSRRPSTLPTSRWSGSNRRSLRGIRSRAVRLRRHDAGQGDHLRQSDAAERRIVVSEVDKAFARQVRARVSTLIVEKPLARRCSSRCVLREMDARQPRGGCRRCACIRRKRVYPAISISCITARARSAAPV